MIILLYFTIIFFCISSFLVLIPFFLQTTNKDLEKVSSYECGFEPFGNARSRFDINFYLVGIMFIIFDIEVAFLLPWCISFQINNIESFLVFLVIVLIFILGFIFESKAKVLDWNRLDLKKKNEKLL